MKNWMIYRYIRDARQAYQACIYSLGLPGTPGLSVLLRAARSRLIERKGQITAEDGIRYAYHIHGLGYSFNDLNTGKVIHFDVIPIGGVDCIRFSVWKLHQYALSVGEAISEERLTSELLELTASDPYIVHVLDGPYDYYYYTYFPHS